MLLVVRTSFQTKSIVHILQGEWEMEMEMEMPCLIPAHAWFCRYRVRHTQLLRVSTSPDLDRLHNPL